MNDEAEGARQGAAPPARSMLRGTVALLSAAHPEPAVAVTLAACALALGADLGARTWLVALAVGSGQLSIGWSNDWLDARRDRAAGRRDKPVAVGRVGARTVIIAALVAVGVCIVASLALGAAPGTVHLVAVAAGWAYNVRAKHHWYSVVPWAVAFGLLPAVVTLAAPTPRWPTWWMLVAGATLGAGAHVANAIPDLDDDRVAGIAGLPHRLGRGRAHVAAVALIAVGIAAVAIGARGAVVRALIAGCGTAALAAVGSAMHRQRDRLAFRLVVVLLVLLAAAVVVGGTTMG